MISASMTGYRVGEFQKYVKNEAVLARRIDGVDDPSRYCLNVMKFRDHMTHKITTKIVWLATAILVRACFCRLA